MGVDSWTLAVTIGAIGLSVLTIRWMQKYREQERYHSNQGWFVRFLKFEQRVIHGIYRRFEAYPSFNENQIENFLELLLLGALAIWLGRDYLDFGARIVPGGGEYGSAVQTHHLWTRFLECGWCALWNGSTPGGSPAFADPYGSMLHPLVAMTTLLFGVVNGSKVALITSFWIAGVAQWWIARELRVSRIPRIWSSAVIIMGGHLAGKMEQGLFGIVLSTAMTSLVFGGILAVANRPGKRTTILLGLAGGSALLSGQGYLQLGLVLSLPAVLIMTVNHRLGFRIMYRRYLSALVIAIFLAAVFLVPFLHFSPNFVKYIDTEFSAAQPMRFLPLNFVIDSIDYYQSTLLEKLPYPALYNLYVGWVPILLAIIGMTDDKFISRPVKWYLFASAVLILAAGSGLIMKPLAEAWEAVAGFRHISLLAGLSVPLILGLSAVGLEKLLDQEWPELMLFFSRDPDHGRVTLQTRWILIIPLLFSVYQAFVFSSAWIFTEERSPEVYQVAEALETDTMQWVLPPFGEHIYIEPAVKRGLKLSPGIIPWNWNGRSIPVPYLEASHAGEPMEVTGISSQVNEIFVYSRHYQEYATVRSGPFWEPCRAYGQGGRIDVFCSSDIAGDLTLLENSWPGWKAWRDGTRIPLIGGELLRVEAPAGSHSYSFRYRPWDVPLGMIMTLAGVIVCFKFDLIERLMGLKAEE